MRFGVTLPNVGVGEDPFVLVDLAREAEAAGWDGVFVWDTPYVSMEDPLVSITHETWMVLVAMAAATDRVLLGTMITPLAWRKPAVVARQAETMQRMSAGRFVFSTGLGYPSAGGEQFGEEIDRRARARMLDEGLQILSGAWSGERFSVEGTRFVAKDVRFLPKPVSKIPVWVVGAWHRDPHAWPKKKSLRRALAWDGVLPNICTDEGPTFETTPDDLRAMTEWIRATHEGPIDVIWEGGQDEDGNTPADVVGEWRDAGATWWLEAVWGPIYEHPGEPERIRERIRSGPPSV